MARWFRRRELRQWAPEPLIPPYPGANMSGLTRVDTPESAMAVSAVWACVRLVSDAISMMRIQRFKMSPDGTPVLIPTGALLDQPAAGRTFPEWIYEVMVSLLLRGNAYGRILAMDPREHVPSQIELQSPDRVSLRANGDGTRSWWFGNVLVPNDQVWHVRGFAFPGATLGLSPITYAVTTLSLAARAEDFAERFFADGAHPTSILTTDHTVDQATAQIIKDRFRTAVNGREPVIMGLGLKHEQIQISPEESQFLLTQRFSVSQIARFFGVPAEMIGGESGGSLTYANVEQRSLDFLTYCIQPWLTRIEASLSMMLPVDQYVRFDTSVLTRTDAETHAKVQAMQLAARVRTTDELRRQDGLPPLTDAQKAELDLVPLEVTPLGGVKLIPGTTPAQAGATNVHLQVMPAAAPEVRIEAPITVMPSPPAQVHFEAPINVEPAQVRIEAPINVASPEVRIETPITVAPADVRVQIPPAPEPRRIVRTVERDANGDMARIVEETT